MISISIIIVSYNVKEFLQQCILSVERATRQIAHEIIVIDNNSVDGSAEIIRLEHPAVHLIENDTNRGFASACNQGLNIARGEILLLLNPDTIIQEDTIVKMLEFFSATPDAGAAGCKILNSDGSLQLACRRSFPTPGVALTKLLGLGRLFPRSRLFARYNLTYLPENEQAEVEAISGSFLMFRRAIWERIGGLDENFFMYGEDLDFCYRIREAGWKIYYVPATKIVHYKGESTKLASFDNFVTFYKAMDIFVKKHFNPGYSIFFDFFLRLGIFVRGLISLTGQFIRQKAVMVVDGFVLAVVILIATWLQSHPLPHTSTLINMIVFYVALWLATGYTIGLYDRRELSYSRAAVASLVSFIASIMIHFIFGEFIHSPQLIVWSFIIALILLPGWRIFLMFLQRRRILPPSSSLSRALLSRRTILIGGGDECERIAKKLQTHIEHGFEILGYVEKKFSARSIAGFQFLGTTDNLAEIIRIHKATEIIFTTDRFTNDEILNVIDRIRSVRVNFKIVPKNFDYILGKSSVEKIDDIPLLEVDYNLLHTMNRINKRILDIIIALPLTLIATPIIVPLSLLIGYRFRRKRFHGLGGSEFTAFILRRNHGRNGLQLIESFPLVWSVLIGDMSLVGAEVISVKSTGRRLRCKPGLTGLFQLQENHLPDDFDKQNYEFYYLQNRTLFLDIEILLKAMLKI